MKRKLLAGGMPVFSSSLRIEIAQNDEQRSLRAKSALRHALVVALGATALTSYGLPTYEPFTEFANQVATNSVNEVVTTYAGVPVGTNASTSISNCLDLATGGFSAPSGEQWGAQYFSGTINNNNQSVTPASYRGLDIAVVSNSALFTSANLASILPASFPGFPANGSGISTLLENPAQPQIWGTKFSMTNYVGNSAVFKFAQDITRPATGTKTLYISYLFSVAQQGALGSGNQGRYLAFVSATNLSEGYTNNAGVPGAAYTNWSSLYNVFPTSGTKGTNPYASHGLLSSGSSFLIGACDSSAGKEWSTSPFTASYGTPLFVVGAYVLNNGANQDTNFMWVNPAISNFGGPTPPTSPVQFWTTNTFVMSDLGGVVFLDRPGSGMAGGVGTNYIANLIIGSTWSYVTGGPEFTNQPTNSTSVNIGQNVSLSAAATAAGQSVNYQWVKITAGGSTTNNLTNGAGGAGGTATVSGANTTTLTLTGISAGDVGNFQLVATASSTGYTLNSANAVVALSDPQFTANPISATTNYGQTVTFTAQVTTANAPLTFQWYKDSTPLSNGAQPGGSTASGTSGTTGAGSDFALTLTLSGVTYQDAGAYLVYATNNSHLYNSSQPAALSVNDPYIATQPANPSVAAGGNATFIVVAAGTPTLTYQWYENGNPLSDGGTTATGSAIVSGSQTASLTLTGVQDADDGSYTCTISGTQSGQTTNSQPATLTVQDALTVVSTPVSRAERVGDHLAFVVSVVGGGPSFQWNFNGNPIAGATTSSLVLTNIQTTNAGTYAVTVQNLATSPQSYSATLSVINSTILNLSSANLIVSRIGDGAQALSLSTGNTIYLDQYTTSGTYQNTIQVPDEAVASHYGTGSSASVLNSPALLAAGAGSDAGYEAMLSLSSINQEFLGLAGYCQAYPFTGGPVNSQPGSWRGLATVNVFGTYSLAYTNSGLYSAGGQLIRAMFTLDGVNFWTAGSASAGTIKYVNATNTSYINGSGVPSSSGVSATGGRSIQIVPGPLPAAGFSSISNLVISDAGQGANNGLYSVAATNTIEPGPSQNIAFTPLLFTGGGQPGDFAFSPDNATIYVADSGTYTGSGSAGTGGIERWDSDGSGWTYSYTLAVLPGQASDPSAITNGAQGMVVDFSANSTWGSGVTGAKIYATTFAPETNSLVEIIDNGDPATTPATITMLATAGPNQAFRGVRFGPSLVLPYVVSAPQSLTNFPGNTVTFSVVAGGSGPFSYQWLQNGNPLSNGADPLNPAGAVSGVTSATLTISNISFADNNSSYSVRVTNPVGQSTTSPAGILTVTAGAPTITPTTLANYTETVGDHVGWLLAISGTLPITYAWHLSGNPNAIATGTITSPGAGGGLVLTNIQATNSGTYVLSVTNQYGSASTTAGGVLTVTASPQTLSSANLVVARIGDSVQPLSAATGNTLYLDQYTPNGGYVSSIQIPDEGTSEVYGTGGSSSASMPPGSPALLFEGAGADAPYEAFLTLSPDGQALSFAGYCQAYPFAGPDVSVIAGGSPNWHGIAEVNAYGYYTLAWTNTGLYSAGAHQVHGAVDIDGNGTNWYSTGEAGSGFGIKYLNVDFEPASGNGIASVAGSFPGTRVAQIVNGNLVYSDGDAADGTNGIYACFGLPLTTATTALQIPDTNSPMDFAASPDLNTVYVSDNGVFTGANNVSGGIQRWDMVGGVYTFNYVLATGTGSTIGARGLTVDFSASATWGAGVTGAKLYATTAESSANRLIRIVDNGQSSSATLLASASPNQLLGGVRFGPSIVPPSFAVQPQSTNTFAGMSATFTADALGSGPLAYQWYFQANGVGAFVAIGGATNASYTINAAGSGNVGNYYVIAKNPGGLTSQSQTVSFGLAALPQFTAETFLGSGGFQLNFTGPAGFAYSIWGSSDVTLAPIESTWTKLTTGAFSGGTDIYTDPNGGINPQQFYVITVP